MRFELPKIVSQLARRPIIIIRASSIFMLASLVGGSKAPMMSAARAPLLPRPSQLAPVPAGKLLFSAKLSIRSRKAKRLISSHQRHIVAGHTMRATLSSSSKNDADQVARASPEGKLQAESRTMDSTREGLTVNGHNGHIRSLDDEEYNRAIGDLNSLQSNTQVVALAKYKKPETILPLFQKQLALAGTQPDDLNRLNAIHISGTKGKGSTCVFLEEILMRARQDNSSPTQAKLKIGCYNSPHLINVTERIRINGEPIEKYVFTRYFRHVFDKLKMESERQQVAMPSYFAFLTILAFHIFLEERVDCAIVEVGIGGEYDPTNIIPAPVACAITTLDLDHTNILGNTVRSIAWTKAGIIKPRVPMFTIGHEQPEALESISARARERSSRVFICKPLEVGRETETTASSACDSMLGIKGPAQALNAALACQLAKYFLLSPEQRERQLLDGSDTLATLETNFEDLPESFREGLRKSHLPGRCQIIDCVDATFFLDGAHTKKSMENCLKWFSRASKEIDETAVKVLMVNVIGERNKSQVLQPMIEYRQVFDQIIFTSNKIQPTDATYDVSKNSDNYVGMQGVNHERSLDNTKNNAQAWISLIKDSNESIKDYPRLSIEPSIIESIESITSGRVERPHVLATGSLHFVGALTEAIRMKYRYQFGLNR